MQDTENTQKTVEFVGSIERQVFSNGDNFWVYGMVVSKDDYPDIKQNKYKNVTINGNLKVSGDIDVGGSLKSNSIIYQGTELASWCQNHI